MTGTILLYCRVYTDNYVVLTVKSTTDSNSQRQRSVGFAYDSGRIWFGMYRMQL
jgi:hypothetical protein